MGNRRADLRSLDKTSFKTVNEQPFSWFHCAHCDSLFQAQFDSTGQHVCAECGQHPSAAPPTGIPFAVPTYTYGQSPKSDQALPAKREVRKHTKAKPDIISRFIGVWLLMVLLAIGAGIYYFSNSGKTKQKPALAALPQNDSQNEDHAFLMQGMSPCRALLDKFLTTESLTERAQLTLSPQKTTEHMARQAKIDSMLKLDKEVNVSQLKYDTSATLKLPSGRAIESYASTPEGKFYNPVFVENEGKYTLDWEHFVRYSDYPWSLFLVGDGPEEGEFRVFARSRNFDNADASSVTIVMYEAEFGQAREKGKASPEFRISKESKNGRLLDAAFQLEKAGKKPFGLETRMTGLEGYIQARVRVRRHQEVKDQETLFRFELVDVIACHWYSTVDPGMKIDQEPKK